MLFISHSSKDLEVVRALIYLFRSALAISPEEIRCTSLEGYRLPAGASVDEKLRQEVHEAKVFIGLISYNSLQSIYVVFELGARWGAEKHLIPLLAPGAGSDILKAPLSSLNALSCESVPQLQQLVAELASLLQVRLNPVHTYQSEIDKIIALPRVQGKMIVPAYLAAQLQLDFATRRKGLADSQKEMLQYLETESKKRASVPQQDFEAEFGSRLKPTYWRLEPLCYLGFIEKEVTHFGGNTPRYNYRLSNEYKTWLSKLSQSDP